MARHDVALADLELWRGALRTRSARPSATLGHLRRPRDRVGTHRYGRNAAEERAIVDRSATYGLPNLFPIAASVFPPFTGFGTTSASLPLT